MCTSKERGKKQIHIQSNLVRRTQIKSSLLLFQILNFIIVIKIKNIFIYLSSLKSDTIYQNKIRFKSEIKIRTHQKNIILIKAGENPRIFLSRKLIKSEQR